LEPGERDELTRWLRGSVRTRMRASPEIEQAFRRIARVMEDSPAWVVSELAVQLNRIVLGLFHMMRAKPPGGDARLLSSEETVRRFLAELQANEQMRSHPWTLEEMAEECGMGVTRFCACARSLHNQSPLKLLSAWRLDAPVTELAFRHGFNSSQYFATCFRRRFHCSPRHWRH
jgi:AraC family L-rhamnose operon regulatory protein RhaS